MKKGNELFIVVIVLLAVSLGFLGGYILKDNLFGNKTEKTSSTEEIGNKEISESPNEKENTESKDEKEIDDSNFISIATRDDNKIVVFTSGGSEIELMDLEPFNMDIGGINVVYTYSNNRLYVYVEEDIGKTTLGYIDLNSDNKKFIKMLTTTLTIGDPSSIAIADNVIYYTSLAASGVCKIHKYDINTNQSAIVNDFNFSKDNGGIFLYTVSDKQIGYYTMGSEGSIGIIDVKTNLKKEIVSQADFEYVYNGNIIYSKNNTYYEYNIVSESSKQINNTVQNKKIGYRNVIYLK